MVKIKPTKKIHIGTAQRDILLSAIVSIGLVLAGLYWVKEIEQPRAFDNQIIAITSNIAEHQSRVISTAISTLSARSTSLASSPLFDQAANAGNGESLEKLLKLSFPEAVDAQILRLGKLGIADEDTDTQRLRNNIEVDMLRKALESQALVIEGYQQNQQWLLSFTQPVNDKAALFISFPASYFSDMITILAGSSAHNELIQTYKSRTETILSTGSTRYSNYSQTRPLSIPGWSIVVYPTELEVEKYKADDTLLWLFSLVCIALLACSHSIFFLRSLDQPKPTKKPTAPEETAPIQTVTSTENVPNTENATSTPAATSSHPDYAPPPHPEVEIGYANAGAKHLAAKALPPAECFRAYDIRGDADTQLTDENCYLIARAIASEAIAMGQRKILLGRDGRLSSPRIRDVVLNGFLESGLDVIDIGLVATPMLHFASKELNIGNVVMITGSHNPAKDNGLKIGLDFQALSDGDIQGLYQRIIDRDFAEGQGKLELETIEQRYIDRICGDVVIAQTLKVVIDASNGATSNIAAPLFEELGCDVIPINCEIDGRFPNHPPDPTIEANLQQLREAVLREGADIGIAFDGDGDRLAVVSGKGECPRADRLLMILAEDVVSRNPGCEILFDIKSTRSLPEMILALGGKPTMWKCGHSFMKRKLAETGALLGGEYSGHIFFNERWYGFDDGMYTAARLLESLSLAGRTLDDALAAHPARPSTPEIIIPVEESRKFAIVDAFAKQQHFSEAEVIDIDGVRLETRSGWALLRASNTGPALSLRFEADSDAALDALRSSVKEVLARIDPAAADSL
ncbi:phosphomannomutase/phosphoglucomutase [Spongiibacter sp. KMU-158]|uniref:phosphomannomutase n=1 Tax=Spongiibacter pelagi TaxID=2760804 RepID=A0A927C043_9GAMM|nr:phosphomannomutase/phosphoglucomutase [Spongiibacter pelagi]MBD2857427.1 phosphomannomutase/phosphoglucomutase [Spongiibacter pelagi]